MRRSSSTQTATGAFRALGLIAAAVVLWCGAAVAEPLGTFTAFVDGLWPEAKAAGVSRETFDRVFTGMAANCNQPDVHCGGGGGAERPRVPMGERTGLPSSCNKVSQKEFLQPEKYFPAAYMRRLALRGRDILANLQARDPKAYRDLMDIEANFRVPHLVLMGLWGRETAFGEAALEHNALQALASSAYAGIKSRRAWARQQLISALKMVERGDVSVASFRSSYAGATGLTQIMPTEYLGFAVDGDLDGRKDIWRSVADSMATTANVLKDRGWRSSERSWGYEVVGRRRPINCLMEGVENRWPLRRWMTEFGVQRVPRRDLDRPGFPNPENSGYLVMPAGTRGPAFLVTGNFDVLRRYNPSELYALFVGHLGDRIGCDTDKTECGFYTPWPQAGSNDFEFSVENICRLQMALRQGGFMTAQPDGLFGAQTRVAIGRYQVSRNQEPDCYPNRALFDSLVGSSRAAATRD